MDLCYLCSLASLRQTGCPKCGITPGAVRSTSFSIGLMRVHEMDPVHVSVNTYVFMNTAPASRALAGSGNSVLGAPVF